MSSPHEWMRAGRKGEHTMMGSQEVINRLLWGWLVMLSLACTAQANTLS